MSNCKKGKDEIETYYYEDDKGTIYRGEHRVTEEEALVELSPEKLTTLYRVKAVSKRGNVEVSAASSYRSNAEDTLRFWKKTGYHKKLWIQVRHVSSWEDEKENN